jgi:hypothetical protein
MHALRLDAPPLLQPGAIVNLLRLPLNQTQRAGIETELSTLAESPCYT